MALHHHLTNHFGNCQLLAVARDVHRGRDVRIYLVPGWPDTHVGVSDGTDAWIAPVVADPFTVRIAEVITKVRNGTFTGPVTPEKAQHARKRLTLDVEAPQQAPQQPRAGVVTRRKLLTHVDGGI